MPKLNNSLYFLKQEENNCYNTNKAKTESNLSLGKTCYKNLDCESKNCSNFLNFPGKCIKPKNTSKIFEGQKCNYEKDCKKNLSCVNNLCVKSSKKATTTILQNRGKGLFNIAGKMLGGLVDKYTPNILKGKKSSGSSGSSGSSNNISTIDDSEISNLIESGNYFMDDESKYSDRRCKQDKFCKNLDNDHKCFKNKCVGIHKRCKVSKNEACIKNSKRVDIKD